MNKIKVIVAGPRGRMGIEAVQLVLNTDQFELISVLDRKNDGAKLSEIEGLPNANVPIFTDAEECFQYGGDVLVDLTTPENGYKHAIKALNYHIRAVIGTTGFSDHQLMELKSLAEKNQTGIIIAPNFAIGAVLMMKFSQMAAKYFQDVEIIEMHHDQKLDAPSGTAIKTAQMMMNERESKVQGHSSEVETLPGARGAQIDGIRIHSIRLPGLVAHQQVMLGLDGQLLTLRHDSFNRKSFMSGVKVAIESVMKIDTFVYGLENILD
jgi:4-hydroxy-tetrahydrodipicolinate reductase